MEYPFTVSDEVFPMNYAAGVVMAARMRVVAFSSTEAGVIFSQPSQGCGPVRPPTEFHPEGNPEFLEHLFIELADNARLDWKLIPAGATARDFIRWNQNRRGDVSKTDATPTETIEEIVFEDLPISEPANLLRFPTAFQVLVKIDARECYCPTSWFALDIKPPIEVAPKNFQPDDLVWGAFSGFAFGLYRCVARDLPSGWHARPLRACASGLPFSLCDPLQPLTKSLPRKQVTLLF